ATSDSACVDSITQTINVYQNPIADFTFTNVCDNDTVKMQDNSTANAPSISNYYWDIDSSGSIDYSSKNVQNLYNNAGEYSVVHWIENSQDRKSTRLNSSHVSISY